MLRELFEQLGHPSSEYRGAPFWSWNGKLDPEELRKQIRVMRDMGMGGFFMHARTGLDTAYLSDEWFECVEACVDEAEKLEMRPWLYDEDRYASGAAGGLVTKDPKYRRRNLDLNIYNTLEEYTDKDQLLGLYLAEGEGRNFENVREIRTLPDRLEEGTRILQVYVSIEECSSWFNNYTYPDTLNPEAIQRFVEVTHKEYEKRFKDKFGSLIPGIFTDEPNYHNHVRKITDPAFAASLPWTDSFPEVFEKRHGHALAEVLPLAFSNTEESARTKWEYFDCASYMITEAFSHTIGAWCEENGLMHTGHVLLEDSPSSQTTCVGSSMRFYEYMQAPGIDVLTEHTKIYDTAKQCSSVANQFGRRWRISETYGVTGWDFPFAGHKALSDWQAALGINFRCHHLYHYTLLGQAKRDYPASIGHHSPWYKEYPLVEDYYARINLLLSHGTTRCDILCIHPVESAFMAHGAEETAQFIDKSIIKTRQRLLEAHLDFDYGDEELMAKHGRIDGGELVINLAGYKAVVVPAMYTMRSTTLSLLRAFRANGGIVVFADPDHIPYLVDARPSDEVRDFAETCDAFDAMDNAVRNISITDETGAEIPAILYQRRTYDDANEAVFICNTSDSETRESVFDQALVRERQDSFGRVMISYVTPTRGKVIEIVPETGERFLKKASYADGAYTFETSFEVFQSRIFAITSDEAVPADLAAETEQVTTSEVALDSGPYDITLDEPNVLVLDRARYRLGDGDWQPSAYNLFIDRDARIELDIPRRGDHMAQPWTVTPEADPASIAVELEYAFAIETMPGNGVQFAIEKPELYTVRVNGQALPLDNDRGYWVDDSLRLFDLPLELLTQGANTIALETTITAFHPGLESIYLLGEFGVRINGLDLSVVEPPRQLSLGDWTHQGLPFYSGAVSYATTVEHTRADGERITLKLGDVDASCVAVWVNGQKAGVAAWAPWEVEITELLNTGENQLELKLYSHRRNSHGPLYQNDPHPKGTSPNTFMEYNGRYALVSCGLGSAPQIAVRSVTG
jgi:hypothetical protein